MRISVLLLVLLFLQPFQSYGQDYPDTVQINMDHVAISVTDLEESEQFYGEVVGLEQIPEPFGVGMHAWFQIGDSELHVIEASEERVERERHNHISFRVDDLEAFIERISAHGVEYSDFGGNPGEIQERPDGVRQIYFADPDGYWIEVNDNF